MFAVSNFSFKLPAGFDQRRNDELVTKRMAAISQEIGHKQAVRSAEESKNRHAAEVLALCEKFYRWASRNRVPKTPKKNGRMLAEYTKYDDNKDSWYPLLYRLELWVMSNGKVRVNYSHRPRYHRPDPSYLQDFTMDSIHQKIARFVNISGKAWDE